MPNESHVGMALQATIDALRALYPRYRYNAGDLGVGLETVEAHYRALSRIVGWKLPVPEGTLNLLGYAALGDDDPAQAIAIFERNAREHPLSANAQDSLADGYAAVERWDEAVAAGDRAAALADRYGHPQRDAFAQGAARRRAEAEAQTAGGK